MSDTGNTKKIEQRIANAQKELDEAQAELKRLQDPWRHDAPVTHKWLMDSRGVPCQVIHTDYNDGKAVIFFHDGYTSWSSTKHLSDIGWRYAKPGEVKIEW